MGELINIYCDESCHLENDHQKAMVLGAVWCPASAVRALVDGIRDIKVKHGLPRHRELKWTDVSPSKLDMFLDVGQFFFERSELHFRGLVVRDKSQLRHVEFPGQNHDIWYYKMYFTLIKTLIESPNKYRIYLDIKDTRSASRVRMLHDVISCNHLDFDRQIIEYVQNMNSYESELMQLADLFAGAIAHYVRGETTSAAKEAVVSLVMRRTGLSLRASSLVRESKFNVFFWEARNGGTRY